MMKMKLVFFYGFLSGFLLSTASAMPRHELDGLTGSVYQIGTERKTELFKYQLNISKKPEVEIHRSQFFDQNGQVVATEKLIMDGKANFMKYAVHQIEAQEIGEIERRGNKIIFEYTVDGKKKTSEEDWIENFVVGPTLIPYLKSQWEKVLKGEDINVRFGVPQRRELIGFKLFKVGEESLNGKKVIVVKMKPSSFFINMLVKPLFFKLSEDGGKVYEMIGRTTPYVKKGVDEFKDADAETVFHHDRPRLPHQ